MAKATLTTRAGTLVTIEGTEAEVSTLVTTLDRDTGAGKANRKVAKATAGTPNRKRASASDLVIALKEDGFFDKPQGLSEISKALEEQGYIYPTTTLSGVVLRLVQRRLLGRRRTDGKWVYGK